jgi:hypothetical protein
LKASTIISVIDKFKKAESDLYESYKKNPLTLRTTFKAEVTAELEKFVENKKSLDRIRKRRDPVEQDLSNRYSYKRVKPNHKSDIAAKSTTSS